MPNVKAPLIPKNIKLIAFDLDDTLWPCMPTIIAAEEALYAWLKENFPLISNRYSMTSMMGKRKDFMLKNPDLDIDLTKMRYQFLAHLAQQCHYSKDQVIDVAEQGLALFMQKRNEVNFYPDVLPSLERLSQKYLLASISNGNADVYQTEAGRFMNYAVNAADVGAAKPDVKMFRYIEQQANVKASECLYIGDDFERDILGAQRAGWDCILLKEGLIKSISFI